MYFNGIVWLYSDMVYLYCVLYSDMIYLYCVLYSNMIYLYCVAVFRPI